MMSEEFGASNLFLFLPAYAHQNLLVIDPVNNNHALTVMQDFGNPGGSTATLLRVATTPPMEKFDDRSTHSRCMAINGSIVVQTEFGNCNGILRWKRYTQRDSHRTPDELLNDLKAGVQGVMRKTLSGSDTITMHAGVHNRNQLSQYSERMCNHWGYYPNEYSDAMDAGLSPLSGWIFTITNVSATQYMPSPTVHIAAQVRIQRELTLDDAYLADQATPIDPERLSHCKRNESAFTSLRGKVDDLRSAVDAATALGASLGTAAVAFGSLRRNAGGGARALELR